jgi:hypothetical protein
MDNIFIYHEEEKRKKENSDFLSFLLIFNKSGNIPEPKEEKKWSTIDTIMAYYANVPKRVIICRRQETYVNLSLSTHNFVNITTSTQQGAGVIVETPRGDWHCTQ